MCSPSYGAAADGRADLLQLPLQLRCAGARRRRLYAAAMASPFRYRMRVRWAECDLQGVVFYANYLAYFDVAMTELWRSAVAPYGDMNENGADMVVAEARIAYRASARFDDEIDLVASVLSMGETSMTDGAGGRARRRGARRG